MDKCLACRAKYGSRMGAIQDDHIGRRRVGLLGTDTPINLLIGNSMGLLAGTVTQIGKALSPRDLDNYPLLDRAARLAHYFWDPSSRGRNFSSLVYQ